MVGLCLSVAPTAADAQNFRDGIESRGADSLVRRVLHDYGVCVAKGMPNYVRGMLALEPGTKNYGAASRRLADYSGRCMTSGGRLQMGGMLFAGSLAEGMLMNDPANAGWEQRAAYDPARPAYVARNEFDAIGACTVRVSPVATRALFATETSSDGEASAVKALAPAVRDCIRSGMTARVDASTLRAMLALAAYRLSQAPTPATHSKGS